MYEVFRGILCPLTRGVNGIIFLETFQTRKLFIPTIKFGGRIINCHIAVDTNGLIRAIEITTVNRIDREVAIKMFEKYTK